MADYIELTEEERKLALKQVATNIVNRVDPDTQDRRIRQRKLDDENYRKNLERKQQAEQARLEREQHVEKARTDSFLLQKGWTRLPQFHERYYMISSCPYGCGSDVGFLADNSPSCTEIDSTDIPYSVIVVDNDDQPLLDRNSFGSVDSLETHLCTDLSGGKLQSVLHYLLKSNLELRHQIAKESQKGREYMQASMMEMTR